MAIPNQGQHISSVGSVVHLIPFGLMNDVNYGIGAIPNGGTIYPLLDVEDSNPYYEDHLDNVTDTSSWGGMLLDVGGRSGGAEINIVYDFWNDPLMASRIAQVVVPNTANNSTALFNINFSMSCALFIGNGLNYPESDTKAEWIFIPSAKWQYRRLKGDAHNFKMWRIKLNTVASSPIFHMPYDTARLAAYQAHLAGRGRTY